MRASRRASPVCFSWARPRTGLIGFWGSAGAGLPTRGLPLNAERLRRLFARALKASLATPLVIAGCHGERHVKPDVPVGLLATNYRRVRCVEAPRPAYFSPLAVPRLDRAWMVPAPDFVELRSFSYTSEFFVNRAQRRPLNGHLRFSFKQARSTGFKPVVSTGNVCETAVDKEACWEVNQAQDGGMEGFAADCRGFPKSDCVAYYLVTTRGDEVRTYATMDSLRQVLGTIDSAGEAALLAFADGHDVCSPTEFPPAVGVNPDEGFTFLVQRGDACGPGTTTARVPVRVSSTGKVVEYEPIIVKYGDTGCYPGRRPVGLQEARAEGHGDARGTWFANAARLEAASVHAFHRLREELALHGAGQALQDAALASAQDEVRHAEVTTRLARRFGAEPPLPSVADVPLRSLREVLFDNAVEGCVRETYSALLAHHQALHAEDAEIREAMARIAEDETRHAGLSWDIDAWAAPRLSDAERSALREARRQALAVLRAEMAVPLDAQLTAEAGLPSPAVALALLDSLEQELWA
ncbi:ferritin-like domain-containing protein [Corallococcus exiguus]|uniref:ferritin-like domain-containing protein n=1 Tax=Corallococcus exiguus TaxID=83462 RepID=UPI0020A66CB1|nr:ferritin-like domain-containing protein [Corallococcus exiguus]